MSYDIELVGPDGKPVEVAKHAEGGTYVPGGTTDAHLNVTYNYSPFFRAALDKKKGVRWLYEKNAKRCYYRLMKAIALLGTHRSDNYWEATPGNAGHALRILFLWALRHPDAVFRGD